MTHMWKYNRTMEIDNTEKQLRKARSSALGWEGAFLIAIGKEIIQSGKLENQIIGGAMFAFGLIQIVRVLNLSFDLGKRVGSILHRAGIVKDRIDKRVM